MSLSYEESDIAGQELLEMAMALLRKKSELCSSCQETDYNKFINSNIEPDKWTFTVDGLQAVSLVFAE